MNEVKICTGLSDISDSYNGFIIDQWGTLHDGDRPFPDVISALQNLKSRGKQIILLSNSGKRSDDDIKRISAMGIDNTLFDHVITSTEATWKSLDDRSHDLFKDTGNKCFLMNRHGDKGILEGLDNIHLVDDIAQADFILLTGSDAPEKTIQDYYDPLLKEASRKQIKMFCANPEKTITIAGVNHEGSGGIARRYEEFGGVVNYIGKPFPSVFQYAMSLFVDIYPSQICVVGDSLATDIRGARYLDLDCALIASGVHKGSFSRVKSTSDIHKMLKILGKNHGCDPTYFLPKFHWGKELPDRKNKRKAK